MEQFVMPLEMVPSSGERREKHQREGVEGTDWGWLELLMPRGFQWDDWYVWVLTDHCQCLETKSSLIGNSEHRMEPVIAHQSPQRNAWVIWHDDLVLLTREG